MKKVILVSLTVLLGVSLFMAGCGDAEGGAAGSTGSPGSPGTGGSPGTEGSPGKAIATVSGNQSAAGFQVVIDSADEVIVTGAVVITGATPIIVKTGKKLRLAAGLQLVDTGSLVIQDETGVSGKGAVTAASGTAYLVAPPAVTAEYEGNQYIAPVPLLAVDDEEFDASAAVLGVRGPLTIDGPVAAAIGAKGVFVTGDVTVEAAIGGAATIVALGDVTITEAQTQAVSWGVGGNLIAQKTPTADSGAGVITVGGNAEFTEALSGVTGAVTIGGNAEFTAGLTTAGELTVGGTLDVGDAAAFGGALRVGGATIFESTVESDNVALTFGGSVEFKGNVERKTAGAYAFGGDVTIADGGTITLGGATGVGLKKGKSIKAGSNVALTAAGGDVVITPVDGAILTATEMGAKIAASTANIEVTSGTLAVSGELEATDKNITFKAGTGVLAINAGGKVTTNGAVDSGAIVLGTSATNGVTLTGDGSWTAGGSGVYLTNAAAKATLIGKIGSAAATLTATGEPTITVVIAGDNNPNVLTLGAGVTIDVGGVADKVGAVVLKGTANKSGSLKLTDDTSIVKTGNTGGSAYGTGVKQGDAIAVVPTLGTKVIVTGNNDKIVSVAGGGDGDGTIAAPSGSNDISIDGGTETKDANS